MDDLPLHSSAQTLLEQIPQRPKGSYVFHGPAGVGKSHAARWLAQRLNCRGDTPAKCRNCLAIEHGNFPDLWISEQGDEQIKIEHVRAMIGALGLVPYYASGHRVFILDTSHGMTAEAQNALLKAFEEPPARTVIIAIVTDLGQLLPTVRSRCEAVYFAPPTAELTAKWLAAKGISTQESGRLAGLAGGQPLLAWRLSHDTELQQAYTAARTGAQQLLVPSLFDRMVAAKQLAEHKDTVELVAGQLAALLRTSARQSSVPEAKAAQGLAALETFRRHLRANVAPKAALECLALELPR